MKTITDKKDRVTEKKGRWREKVYSKQLVAYAEQNLKEDEKAVYNVFFNELVEQGNFDKPQELMLLDTLCYDFIRIKRLQNYINKHGDMTEYTLKNGAIVKKASEASYLLNSIESQFRNTMKELLLTRKESTKKQLGMGAKDFANWMSEPAIVEVDKDGKTTESPSAREMDS